MAATNKTLGRFELTDIPPAPRGVPQIEVSFDIDANGIVHVSAKDLGTGKEQSIKITASSGLSEEEIQNLIKEAELHGEEDKKNRELAEIRNQADSLVYSTEKSTNEMGEKIEPALRGQIEAAINDLKSVMDSNDRSTIEAKMKALTDASHKLAEQIYSQTSQEQAAGGEAGPDAGGDAGMGGGSDEDVVDADFEEVKD
jgi:molecular chaperone DnaK